MPRVVADPGILVSAAITPTGVCGQVLRKAMVDAIALITSPTLLDELVDVLTRPKFRSYLSIAEVDLFLVLLRGIADHHPDPPVDQTYTADPDDDYLIALALAVGADYLISSDRHLTSLTHEALQVLTPRELLDLVKGDR